jgi:AcrR family transcriptional regulator
MEKDLVRDKIILESIELFMNYGIRSVTMDDIAKHLGMSKKTIYRHFKDKEEIILQSTQLYFENEIKLVRELENNTENAVEHLYKLTVCLRERLKNINGSVLFDLKKYYSTAWDMYKKHKHDVIFNSVYNNLKRGISEGFFRKDIQPEILAYLRIGEIELSFNKDFFPEEKFSLSDIHEQLFDHYTHGILSEKGFKLLETYKQKTT